MKTKIKNLLITGGCGFIGSNYIRYFLNKYSDIKIINIDKLTYAGNLNNTLSFSNHKNYKFLKGDITNVKFIDNVFKKYEIDGVINFAAESHVDNSIKNPKIFLETNITGVFNLLCIAKKYWLKSPFIHKDNYENSRFHQISTDEVYGSINIGSNSENISYNPSSPYSASKASADHIVNSFNKTYGLNTTISISSNNFGPNQNSEKFIPKVIDAISKGENIPVYGDGNYFRDWIYVDDNCEAIDKVFFYGSSGEKYNIGSGTELSNNELVKIIYATISKQIDVKLKIINIEDRFGHDKRYSINCDKIKTELGWLPRYDFYQSINKYIKNKLKNE